METSNDLLSQVRFKITTKADENVFYLAGGYYYHADKIKLLNPFICHINPIKNETKYFFSGKESVIDCLNVLTIERIA